MFTSGFFNSINGDRRYNAEQMAAIFDGLITDGIFDSIGGHFQVTPAASGLGVNIGTGRAWLNQTWSYNDTAYPVTLDAASPSLGRKDLICIKVDKSSAVRSNSLVVIAGTPAASPVEPTITDDTTNGIYYHKLAAVTVAAGATSISAADITNYIGLSAGTPYVTGIIQSTTVDELWSQWDGEFNDWWDDIKDTLDENVVTTILNKIDHITPKEATMNLYGFSHLDPPPSGKTYQAYSTDAILNQISNLCKNAWYEIYSETMETQLDPSGYSVGASSRATAIATIRLGTTYTVDTIKNTVSIGGDIITVTVTALGSGWGCSQSYSVVDSSGATIASGSWAYNDQTVNVTLPSTLIGLYCLAGGVGTAQITTATVPVRKISSAPTLSMWARYDSDQSWPEYATVSFGANAYTISVEIGQRITNTLYSLDSAAYPEFIVGENARYYVPMPAIATTPISRSKYVCGTARNTQNLRVYNPYNIMIIKTSIITMIGTPALGFAKISNSAYPTNVVCDNSIDENGSFYITLPSDVASASEIYWLNIL